MDHPGLLPYGIQQDFPRGLYWHEHLLHSVEKQPEKWEVSLQHANQFSLNNSPRNKDMCIIKYNVYRYQSKVSGAVAWSKAIWDVWKLPRILPRLSLETSLQAELHISQLPSEQLLANQDEVNVIPACLCSTVWPLQVPLKISMSTP